MNQLQNQKLNHFIITFAVIISTLKWLMMLTANRFLIFISVVISIYLLGRMIWIGQFKYLKRKPRTIVAFWAGILLLWVASLPVGLFGLSSFFKVAFPLTGDQFTWLTVNRHWLALLGAVIYISLFCWLLLMRHFFVNLLAMPETRFEAAFKITAKSVSLKDLWFSIRLVLQAIVVITGLIIALAGVNYLLPLKATLVISEGIANLVVPIIEARLFLQLFALAKPGPVATFKNCFGYLTIAFGLVSIMGINFNSQTSKPTQQTIIVHRGVINNNGQPNTIGALKRSARHHFPFVEMDVQETKDRFFICAHDDTILIPHLGHREINRLNLRTIQKYHHVELFQQYLQTANRLGQPLIVELKVTNQSDRQMGSRFAKAFGAEMLKQPNMVHSTGYRYLRQIKAQYPEIKVGLVTMLNFSDLSRYKVDFYTLQHWTLTPFLLRMIQPQRRVYAWTQDHAFSMQRLDMMGVNGQVTDQATQLSRLSMNPSENNWLRVLNLLIIYL